MRDRERDKYIYNSYDLTLDNLQVLSDSLKGRKYGK
jgi:hypothetical protein